MNPVKHYERDKMRRELRANQRRTREIAMQLIDEIDITLLDVPDDEYAESPYGLGLWKVAYVGDAERVIHFPEVPKDTEPRIRWHTHPYTQEIQVVRGCVVMKMQVNDHYELKEIRSGESLVIRADKPHTLDGASAGTELYMRFTNLPRPVDPPTTRAAILPCI